MMEKARARLRRILESAQDEVRSSVRKLDEMRNRREIDQTRAHLSATLGGAAAGLEKALGEEAPLLAEVAQAPPLVAEVPEAPRLAVGATVRIPKWKNTGKVLELLPHDKIKVQLGTLQMTLTVGDVEPIAAPAGPRPGSGPKPVFAPGYRDVDRPGAPARELDLRGVRFDDAMSQLEHYLDQAYRSGAYAEVTVIHGLGSGALREGARKLMAELPYVKGFKDGGAGRGGAGATVVEFER
jgi:DNA mismatch repair protein MutS2